MIGLVCGLMELLKKIGLTKFILATCSFVIAIALVIWLSFKLAAPPMSLLYTNLSEQDSALIISRLESTNVPYAVTNNGKDVSVPVAKVLMLRMSFAQEGIPKTGAIVGYEIFDKTESLGTSQFVYNVNLVRALEGEIARTISSLAPIQNARVHLVIPKKELFSKVANDPSASVVLQMKGSQTLSKQEVAAVSHLILTAVSGMKLDNITIIDNRGRPLKLANTDENNVAAMTDAAEEYQKAIESRYKETIEDLLEKSMGVGKIKANIAAEINFDREVINSEVYDPEGQVVRSKKVSELNDSETEQSAEISASTNIQGSGSTGGGTGKKSSRTDEVTNYEISKTITNKISESGRIKRLSIAILVDGMYSIQQNPDNPSAETQINYTPRSQDELDKIKALASSAVGLDTKRGDKIEVINMRFSDEFATLPTTEKPMAWLRDELDNIVQTVVIGIVIILVIILIVRPVISRFLEIRSIQAEENALEDTIAHNPAVQDAYNSTDLNADKTKDSSADGGIPDLFGLNSEDKRKAQLLKYLNSMIDQHPEETVAILRNWLYSTE